MPHFPGRVSTEPSFVVINSRASRTDSQMAQEQEQHQQSSQSHPLHKSQRISVQSASSARNHRQSPLHHTAENEDAPEDTCPGTPSLITLDPHGSLTIVVGSEEASSLPQSLIVTMDIVRRLSPVWYRLVETAEIDQVERNGRWWSVRSSRSTSARAFASASKRTLRLPDEHPHIILQLMLIAHFRYKDVVQALQFSEIVALAQVAKHYQINHMLVHYLDHWTRPFRSQILNPGYEEWLYVACQFGYEEDYLRLARHLALSSKVNEQGQLLSSKGEVILGTFPRGCLGRIAQARYHLLQLFLFTLKTEIGLLVDSNQCKAELPVGCAVTEPALDDIERKYCTSLNYMSLVRALKPHWMWPILDDAAMIRTSVNEVFLALTNVSYEPLRRNNKLAESLTYNLHVGCDASSKLRDGILSIMNSMDWPVDDETLQRLRDNGVECTV